jgi:hypothetical protein
LTRYEEIDGIIYVEAEADWTLPYEMPDSFTIRQWKEEHYRSVKMVRKIAWAEDYFAEVFLVKGVEGDLPVDWVMHFSGDIVSIPESAAIENFSDKKPYRHLNSMKKADFKHAPAERVVSVYDDGGVQTSVFSWSGGKEFYFGKGPDNPSVTEINYQIERTYGPEAVFAHVITSSRGPCLVKDVEFTWQAGGMRIDVEGSDETNIGRFSRVIHM